MRSRCWVLCVALFSACSPALREPPTLDELAGRTAVSPAQARTMLLEGERLWELRELAAVRRAADLFLSSLGADTSRTEALVAAARAHVWLAGHEPAAAVRQRAAALAVQTAQLCARGAPAAPACSYWLALALGVQARERRLTAFDALPKMVELLEQVAQSEPALDHGGPHRVLALVLARAPGWPTGPGDPERGLQQASRALAVDPEYPPNELCLAELLRATGDEPASREHYARAAALARARVGTGDAEAREWLVEAERALAAARAIGC